MLNWDNVKRGHAIVACFVYIIVVYSEMQILLNLESWFTNVFLFWAIYITSFSVSVLILLFCAKVIVNYFFKK